MVKDFLSLPKKYEIRKMAVLPRISIQKKSLKKN